MLLLVWVLFTLRKKLFLINIYNLRSVIKFFLGKLIKTWEKKKLLHHKITFFKEEANIPNNILHNNFIFQQVKKNFTKSDKM